MFTTGHPSYFSDLFSSAEMRAVFSDEGKIGAWLQAEAALAAAEADCGLIPVEAAEKIAKAAQLDNLDLPAMKAEYDRVGFPISPLVHQLAKVTDPESARWIHWGATTQDIIDTGLVLQMREGLRLIESDLDRIIKALSRLSHEHRKTVMAGRTFQQQAAPITFGYKTAVWLDEMLRHRERLPEIKRRSLVCQFGGAVGTLATLGEEGPDVRSKLSEKLELEEPAISWHTARDGWAELIHFLAMIGMTLSKIAAEIATLMRSEVDEVREPYHPGRGASSTMPQKRNPIAAPPVIAIGNRLRECVSSQLTAMMQEHERAVATQPLEWLIIPEAFILLSGALKHSRDTLENLDVDADQMCRNLNAGEGFLMAESVMMKLAPHTGRTKAHHLVSIAVERAVASGKILREELLNDPKVMEHLSESDVNHALEPGNYLGSTQVMIDAVLSKLRKSEL